LLAVFLLSSPELWIDELTDSQIRRTEQALSMLTGQVTDETTTGRTVLWAKGLSIAAGNYFVFGEGLGSFHHFKGFVVENGVEQGTHNTYLMLLGEAGLPVALLFIAANVVLLRALWRERLHYLFMYFVILQIDFLSAHNVLGLRFHDLMIGYTLGVLAYTRRERKTSAMLKIIA
jgi:O-antigen ligase